MIAFKPGVDFSLCDPELAVGLRAAESIYDAFGVPCVVTSLRDGTHMQGSKHYEVPCQAGDLRSWSIPRGLLDQFHARLKERLGTRFDVVLEKRNAQGEHFHIEIDAKE